MYNRAELQRDVQNHPNLVAHFCSDARVWMASEPVDYLMADLSMPPNISLQVLERWLGQKMCTYFIWTIKFSYQETDEERASSKEIVIISSICKRLDTFDYHYTIRNLFTSSLHPSKSIL